MLKNVARADGLYTAAWGPMTSCNTRCINDSCRRTYDDGRRVRFRAKQKWNPFNNSFVWDSGSC